MAMKLTGHLSRSTIDRYNVTPRDPTCASRHEAERGTSDKSDQRDESDGRPPRSVLSR